MNALAPAQPARVGVPSALQRVLGLLASGATLDEAQAQDAFELVIAGEASPAQIAALATALRLRGETAAELAGAVRAMRARMLPVVAEGAMDVCGTGGDAAGTLNISTAVALVVAGCGVRVAKHGNRAASSRSGGADVLAALGVGLEVPPERLGSVLERAGLVFLFAPRHHAGLRHAAGVRAELGFRTIFNLLGPLANPACVRRQLTGVFAPHWLEPMAQALARLGSERAWLVHGGGLDELTLSGPTEVVELDGGALRRFTVEPEQAGLARAPLSAIAGGDAPENARALRELLDGGRGAYRDTVLLNAAAALVVAGRAAELSSGVALAARSIDTGAALSRLEALVSETAAWR